MNVSSVLKQKAQGVVTVGEQVPIHQAAQLMDRMNIGALVVTDGDNVVGMLTQREVVKAFSSHGWRISDLRVADIMRSDFVKVTPQDRMKDVMALMTRHRATHMPVFSLNGLAGIISIGDAVKHRLEELELETSVLRDAYIAVR